MDPAATVTLSDGGTVILSLAGSSVIAAFVSGRLSRNNARDEQLRQQMLDVAGSFAGGAMEALARIRDVKPTKKKPGESRHRNEALWADKQLRQTREERAATAVDQLRPLRGRVNLLFADRRDSGDDTAEKAGRVIDCLREMLEISAEFWHCCDDDPQQRVALEAEADAKYSRARGDAWGAVYDFCDAAAERLRSP